MSKRNSIPFIGLWISEKAISDMHLFGNFSLCCKFCSLLELQHVPGLLTLNVQCVRNKRKQRYDLLGNALPSLPLSLCSDPSFPLNTLYSLPQSQPTAGTALCPVWLSRSFFNCLVRFFGCSAKSNRFLWGRQQSLEPTAESASTNKIKHIK